MKRKSQGLIALSSVFLLGSVLAGCSNGNNNAGASASASASGTASAASSASASPTASAAVASDVLPQTKEGLFSKPLSFSFYVNYDWYAPKGGYGDDLISKYMKEDLQVNIEEISSNSNAKQKLGSMIASNDFPDVVQMDRGSDFDNLVEHGKIVPVNLDVMPNLKALIDPQTLELLKAKDGKLYGIPNWFNNLDKMKSLIVSFGWLVNKPMYEELGSPKLDTIDDLYAYLKLVKSKYPDVVPLDSEAISEVVSYIYSGLKAGNNHLFSQNWYAVPNQDTKTFTSILEEPTYKDALRWVNKLFQEKLLTQDGFTQKREQFQEKMNNGKVAVAATYNDDVAGDTANQSLGGEDKGYMAIKPIIGQGVDRSQLKMYNKGNMGWNFNAVTVDAKEPDRIFSFIDWLLGPEGTRVVDFGAPGDLWDGADETTWVPHFTDKYKNLTDEQAKAYKFMTWNIQGSYVNAEMKNTIAEQDGNADFKTRINSFNAKEGGVINSDQYDGLQSFPADSEAKVAFTNIQNLIVEAQSKLTFAKSDAEFDKIYEQTKKDFEAAGFQKVLDFYTQVWNNNLKKMGQ